MKRKWILTVAVLLLAVLAAGCREGGDSVHTKDPVDTSVQTTTTDATTCVTEHTDIVDDTTAATDPENTEETTADVETTDATVPVDIQEGVSDWEEPVESTPTAGREDQATEPDQEEPQTSAGGNSQPTKPTEGPKPTESSKPADDPKPTESTEKEDTGPKLLTFEEYKDLDAKGKQAYFESFATVEDFYEWLEAAEEASGGKQNNTSGDNQIDIGDYTKP